MSTIPFHSRISPPRENAFGDRKRYDVFRAWLDEIRRGTGNAPLKVLDFGCGTGALLTAPLALDGDTVEGVDAHEPSIALAARTYVLPNLRFGVASLEDLRARGPWFDVVICSEVLEHLPDPERYLETFAEILQPRGYLIASVPNGFGPYEQSLRVERTLDRLGIELVIDVLKWPVRCFRSLRAGRGIPPSPGRPRRHNATDDSAGTGYLNFESGHVQFYTLPHILDLFRAAGFELQRERSRSFICGPYLGFLVNQIAKLPGGEAVFRTNNALADWLPLRFASDWMFLLRKTEQ